jgi:flagellar basal body-associated protein FliL
MEYLIGALLVVLAISLVIAPFFASSEEARPQPESEELRALLAEKQTLYAAIKELEFDHRAGKLALQDYEQTRRSYELRAVALLEEIDRLNRPAGEQGAASRQERVTP